MEPMKTPFKPRGALLCVAIIGCAAVRAQDLKSAVPDCPYYPLAVGTVWKYKMDFAGMETRIESQVTKHQQIADALCAEVETTIDDSTTTEQLRADKVGVRRYGADRAVLKPSELILKLPAKKGDEWKGAFELAGRESTFNTEILATDEPVTVPAGQYKTIVVKTTLSTTGQKVETVLTTYYAANVGPVKRVATTENLNIVFELTEFRPPTARK
jgi:hypothetical protein